MRGSGLSARRQITKAVSPYAVLLTGTTAGSTTTSQESATAIAYNGWKGMADPVANGGAFRYNTTTGSTATFTFTGTALTWLTRKGPGQGIAGVAIDGTNKGNVDLYAAFVTTFAKAYTVLSSGSHTLTVKVTGTKNTSATGFSVAIDGFTVGTTTTQESAGTVGYDTWLGSSSANASSGQYLASGTPPPPRPSTSPAPVSTGSPPSARAGAKHRSSSTASTRAPSTSTPLPPTGRQPRPTPASPQARTPSPSRSRHQERRSHQHESVHRRLHRPQLRTPSPILDSPERQTITDA